MAEHIDLASWEPAYTGNPYPFFAGLREQGPVTQVVIEGLAVWLVTRYEDIREGLSDPRLSNDPELGDAETRAVPWVGASVATAATCSGSTRPITRGRGGWSPGHSPRAGSRRCGHGSSRSPTS